MAVNSPNSPRQKMINLMYLVFIGMLALNVSSEVLEGFELVEEGLLRSVKVSLQRNNRIFGDLEIYHTTNPEKTKLWYEKAVQVKIKTDSLFNYIQELKNKIAIKADGKKGNPEYLKHPDDLNAAYEIMFEQKKYHVIKLKYSIDSYKEYVASLVTNPSIKNTIENDLSTQSSKKSKENKQTWEESMFWQMPVAATITLLTKLQNDICYAAGEVLNDLLKNIDLQDFRVNKIEAFVIPESQIVMQGSSYKANIVLAAQDSTQRPEIFINGKKLSEEANGQYTVSANTTGIFQIKGYVEIPHGDGSFLKRDFETEYFVVQPSATIAPVWMNVLYGGIANDIRIAVPGVANQNVSATISNGTLIYKRNDIWVATPKYGSDAIITIMAKMHGGRMQEMAKQTFRVRLLPNPTAYFNITNQDGYKMRYKGGTPLSKAALAAVEGLNAAIDDGILDIAFTVLRFELSTTDSMGLTVKETSDGSRFSERQKNMIRGLVRGKTILIRGIVTRGPDGIERTLNAPIEIIIN